MAQLGEVYLCEICGNKVKGLEAGEGELTCCQEPMKKVDKLFLPYMIQFLTTQ